MGILPAIIRVAPNSPNALANAKTIPLNIPGIDKGIKTLKNTLSSDAPSVLAEFKYTSSTLIKADLQL